MWVAVCSRLSFIMLIRGLVNKFQDCLKYAPLNFLIIFVHSLFVHLYKKYGQLSHIHASKRFLKKKKKSNKAADGSLCIFLFLGNLFKATTTLKIVDKMKYSLSAQISTLVHKT